MLGASRARGSNGCTCRYSHLLIKKNKDVVVQTKIVFVYAHREFILLLYSDKNLIGLKEIVLTAELKSEYYLEA